MKNILKNFLVVAFLVLVAFFTSASSLEIVGAMTGLICVWAYGRQYIWTATAFGVVNIGAWAYMFSTANLWADASLQILFFFPLTLYGLYVWLKKKHTDDKRKVIDLGGHLNIYLKLATCFVIGSLTWIGILYSLAHYNVIQISVPWIDAPLAVAQIIAQYLLSRKILQNWTVWSIVNIAMIGLMIFKGFYLTSGLYGVFLINSVVSYYSWKKDDKITYLQHINKK